MRARRVNLSGSRLSHIFRQGTGLSVDGYIRQARLVAAKGLLETSFLSLKEIATQVGLSPDRLSHAFKDQFGLSPMRHRFHIREG